VKKIPLLTVGVLLVIGLIGVGTFAISQDVEAGTREPGPEFVFSDLVISPTEASIGQIITISVTVTNMEDPGSQEVTLTINGVVEATKDVTLGRFENVEVTFTTSKDVPGTYSVEIDGIIGSFTVRAVTAEPKPFAVLRYLTISPTEASIGQIVTISATVINDSDESFLYEVELKIDSVVEATKELFLDTLAWEEVTFTISKDVAGTYAVAVDSLTSSFTVRAVTAEPEPFNWALIGGIIAAVVVVVVLVFFLRRRTSA